MDPSDFQLFQKEEMLRMREEILGLRKEIPIIDRGNWYFTDGWHPEPARQKWWNVGIYSGEGSRVFRESIAFNKPFTNTPEVLVSLRGFDTKGQCNARLETAPDNITSENFTLCVRTCADSEIYGVWVTWLAIGT